MERWDLYTRDRQKTGEFHIRGEKMPPERYHLVVQVVIFGSDGRLLIQQRHRDKIGWPAMWDFSAAGSAVAGDSSVDAAVREVQEELGLTLDASELSPALTMYGENFFCDIYLVERDVALGDLRLQETEVQAVRWASEAEILALAEQGQFVPWIAPFISLLFAMRRTKSIRS